MPEVTSDSVHCANCGAAFTSESAQFCAFCGAERPRVEPEVRHVFAPDAEERWASAEALPALKELLERTPIERDDSLLGGERAILWITGWVGLAIVVIAIVTAGDGSPSTPAVVLGLILIANATIRIVRRRLLDAAPWQRPLALVVDKRGHSSEDKSGKQHFVTMRSRAGGRMEWSCSQYLHGRLQAGDLGVAYAKDDRLIDFRKLPV